MAFKISFAGNRLFSNSKEAIDLHANKKLGEFKDSIIIYSSFEALYLAEKNKAEIFSKNKKLKSSELFKKFSKKEKEFHTKYQVFKDLRNKGYIVKTALKFGAEFRVYTKQDKHAKYLVYPISESSKINWHDISAKSRIAHSTNKKLLVALMDKEEDINYYEVNWTKL